MNKAQLLKAIQWFFPAFLNTSTSYSQDGEDMVLKAFYEGKKKYKGYYVDIGAHHPYRFSNTAYFYKKGWQGINIEPTPSLIGFFNRYRKRDINLNIGISDTNSVITFYEFNEPALNSFDRERSLSRQNDKHKIIAEKKIEVFSLKDVLDKHLPAGRKIDFFTIDVEGLDLNVLKSNDWNKYVPEYILVEDEFDVESIAQNEVYAFLKNKSYKLVARTKRTLLFKHGA